MVRFSHSNVKNASRYEHAADTYGLITKGLQMARSPKTPRILEDKTPKAPAPEGARKAGRKPVPEGETRAQAFGRLATSRVQNIAHSLKVIGNLANRSTYDFDDDQVNHIFQFIRAQVDLAESKFKKASKDTPTFTLLKK